MGNEREMEPCNVVQKYNWERQMLLNRVLQDSLTLPMQKHISRHRILHLNYRKYEVFDLYLCKTSECEHIASQGLVSCSGNVFSVL